MGRRVSVDRSHKTSSSPRGEAQEDSLNSHATTRGSLSEPHNSLRSVVHRHNSSSSTSEHGLTTGATPSPSSPYSASASNSSSALTSQTSLRDIRSLSRSSQIDRSDTSAKSLFSTTGKALRRHASKLSLASSISYDKDEEGKVVWKVAGLGAAEQDSNLSWSARKDVLKRAISAPFDFKHVTHTYQEQVRGLERASRNELISEFSAIRAGQRADPQLRGIKAESIVTQGSASPSDSTEPKPKAEQNSEALGTSTIVISPGAPLASPPPPSPKGSNPAGDVRSSRVVENFSRPVSRMSISPISPPKRISSLNACKPLVGISENALGSHENTASPTIHSRSSSRPAINATPFFNAPGQDPDAVAVAVGHAISTTDDSARHLKASPLPMLPAELNDVPEDEEGFCHRESRVNSVESGNRSLPLRHVASFSHDPMPNELWTTTASTAQRHTTSLDDGHTILSFDDSPSNWPESPNYQLCRDANRFSIGLKPMCVAQHWEDDVDYCYEHAAEAESDFDWDQQAAKFSVGLPPSRLDSSISVEQSLNQLQQLAGLRKHDSQESSVLSVVSSIADISASSNSIGSLPELDYSINSSRESMDWETCHRTKRHSKSVRRLQPTSPTKSVKARQGLGLSYSLFPSNTTPPRTP